LQKIATVKRKLDIDPTSPAEGQTMTNNAHHRTKSNLKSKNKSRNRPF